MTGRCAWCRTARGPLIAVGCIEAGSGPGATIWACPTCQDTERLMPLTEHPDGSNGQPRHRPEPVTP